MRSLLEVEGVRCALAAKKECSYVLGLPGPEFPLRDEGVVRAACWKVRLLLVWYVTRLHRCGTRTTLLMVAGDEGHELWVPA